MKISVVMAYYNRKPQLLATLKSISFTSHSDYEIIVVNDASGDNHDISDIIQDNIKIINISKEEKTWINPCIPFNIGIKESTGDIIIIQNPESTHVGDILTYVDNYIKDNDYYSFGCYALCTKTTDNIINSKWNSYKELCSLYATSSIGTTSDDTNGWFNHSKFNSSCYHFCSAIKKDKLSEHGGFDERFAHGLGFEDIVFLRKVRDMGMNITIIDEPYVLHCSHPINHKNVLNSTALVSKNHGLV